MTKTKKKRKKKTKKKGNTNKLRKAARRQALIDAGLFNAYKEKSVPSKKKYRRKKINPESE